jgi:hypothetical protein
MRLEEYPTKGPVKKSTLEAEVRDPDLSAEEQAFREKEASRPETLHQRHERLNREAPLFTVTPPPSEFASNYLVKYVKDGQVKTRVFEDSRDAEAFAATEKAKLEAEEQRKMQEAKQALIDVE